jgi:hypothetical protein
LRQGPRNHRLGSFSVWLFFVLFSPGAAAQVSTITEQVSPNGALRTAINSGGTYELAFSGVDWQLVGRLPEAPESIQSTPEKDEIGSFDAVSATYRGGARTRFASPQTQSPPRQTERHILRPTKQNLSRANHARRFRRGHLASPSALANASPGAIAAGSALSCHPSLRRVALDWSPLTAFPCSQPCIALLEFQHHDFRIRSEPQWWSPGSRSARSENLHLPDSA